LRLALQDAPKAGHQGIHILDRLPHVGAGLGAADVGQVDVAQQRQVGWLRSA
jgi:hypothetical protein